MNGLRQGCYMTIWRWNESPVTFEHSQRWGEFGKFDSPCNSSYEKAPWSGFDVARDRPDLFKILKSVLWKCCVEVSHTLNICTTIVAVMPWAPKWMLQDNLAVQGSMRFENLTIITSLPGKWLVYHTKMVDCQCCGLLLYVCLGHGWALAMVLHYYFTLEGVPCHSWNSPRVDEIWKFDHHHKSS